MTHTNTNTRKKKAITHQPTSSTSELTTVSGVTKVNLLLDLGDHTSHHCHERNIGNTAQETSDISEGTVKERQDFAETRQALNAVIETNETNITRVCCDVVMILNHKLRRRHGESGAANTLDA